MTMFVGVSRVSSKVCKRITLAWRAYAFLWLAVMLSEKLPESMQSKVPPLLGGIVIGILGPPLAFVWGIDAWSFVFVSVLLTASCLLISRWCWRRYPDSEVFGLPLFAAVAVWIGSVWLAAGLLGI